MKVNRYVAELRISPVWPPLMVEQTDTRKCHGDAVLVARLDDMVVAYRSTGLGNVFHAALVGPFDVVTEGEEGIRPQ